MTDLPGVFGTVAPYVQDYGYLAVGLFLLLKNIGIPVPGEAILVTAALVAGSGRLDLPLVILVGFVAAVVGEAIGYAIGRYGGHPVVERYGRRIGITHERLDKLEEFFARHGVKLVLVGRFLPLLRSYAGIAAGISEMPWRRFLVGNAIGAAVWVSVWSVLGAQAGSHIEGINTFLVRSGPVLGLILVLLVVAAVVRRRRTRRRRTAVAS